MQTYTHLVIGGALGAWLFPNSWSAQAACVGAAVLPDLVMIPVFLKDKLAGRQPMQNQSSALMVLKEIGHSLLLWLGLLICSWGWYEVSDTQLSLWLLAAAVSGVSHVAIDIFTHGRGPKPARPYWETDLKFLWPTKIDLRPMGLWEYRYGHGILRPKPFEAVVLVLALALWVMPLIS